MASEQSRGADVEQRRNLIKRLEEQADDEALAELQEMVETEVRKAAAQSPKSDALTLLDDVLRILSHGLDERETYAIVRLAAVSILRLDRRGPRPEKTRLIWRWQLGRGASNELFDRVFQTITNEVKRIIPSASLAQSELEYDDLANEIFLELQKYRNEKLWTDEAHFLNVVRKYAKHILIDATRTGRRIIRGGGPSNRRSITSVEEVLGIRPEASPERIDLDIAFKKLADIDERQKKVIELSLEGMTLEEIAQEMGFSLSTVKSIKAEAIKNLRRLLGFG